MVCVKDEIFDTTVIVKANQINFLLEVIINQFDTNFNLIKTIQSEDKHKEKSWIIENLLSQLIIFQNIIKKKLYSIKL